MKASKWIVATALTLALSGAALAQERDWNRDSNKDGRRATVQTQQERRPAADHTIRTQPAAQWQQQRRDGDENRGRATSQWQQDRHDGDRDRDGDDRYRTAPAYPTSAYYPPARFPNGVYGGYRTQGLSEGQQIGYQDGLNDGAHDRATGHSFRPTQDSNYQHANRGWNSGMIDRDSYSNVYRQAYMQGYQRGFGNAY